jgi:hypothetical protein
MLQQSGNFYTREKDSEFTFSVLHGIKNRKPRIFCSSVNIASVLSIWVFIFRICTGIVTIVLGG